MGRFLGALVNQRPSWAAVAAAFFVAVVLTYVGELFGLNGTQWDWWQRGCFAGAAVLVAAVVLHQRLQTAAQGLPRASFFVAAVSGVSLLAAALAMMSIRYSDPYSGSLFWPHTLALLGLLGFVIAGAAISAFPRSARRASD